MIYRYIVLVLFFLSVNIHAQINISIKDAWISTAPPSISNHAGYLTIKNDSQNQLDLVSISSPAFSKIEIHRTMIKNEITYMEKFDYLRIPAKTELRLKPGDFHLMLYNTNKDLKYGDKISLLLEFSDNTKIKVIAQIKNMTELFQQTEKNKLSRNSGGLLKLMVGYQNLLPQHFLSSLMYRLTRSNWAPFKNFTINLFIKYFDVNMSIANKKTPQQYENFNAFFTRQLKPEARPIDISTNSIVSPVDGIVSQHGTINGERIIQAKGKDFSLTSLLGGDEKFASNFINGDFITLYLSPKHYHRVHMPMNGELKSLTYIPGKLFSVNPTTTREIQNLFSKNERIINIFSTEIGNIALIMVGAIFVGSMETVWAGEITPSKSRNQYFNDYTDTNETIRLDRGQEMGRFNMGSTVILLFEQGKLKWDPLIKNNEDINMGQKLAEINNI